MRSYINRLTDYTRVERDWNAHDMEPYTRKACLQQLLKTAPSDAEREWCKAELKKLNVNVE
ncbi:MAG: hypothetical protein IJM18_08240 [Clostridia bacterium]|nr:hypothetical protein [Clostridia bacterium]